MLDDVAAELKRIHETQPDFTPGLAIVQVSERASDASRHERCRRSAGLQVGDRSDSNVYIRMKLARAADVGVAARHIKLERATSQTQLEEQIRALNADNSIDGIIVQVDDARAIASGRQAARLIEKSCFTYFM